VNEIGLVAGGAADGRRALLAQALRESSGAVKTYPPSFAQERLWFLNQLQPNLPIYVVPNSVRLPQAIDSSLLQRALDAVVERHEALRTTFPLVNGQPVQLVRSDLRVPLTIIDLSGFPTGERENEARSILTADAGMMFDLAKGPLLAATLIRLAPADYVLALTMHHIVSDAWSIGILLRELAALYDAFGRRLPSPLSPLSIQYGDFAAWQRKHLVGEELERHMSYWRERLDGMPAAVQLPTDRLRPPVTSGLGAWQGFALPPPVAASLCEIARAAGATPFMVLLAAFATMLRRYTNQDDIVVGSPIAGRNRTEVEGLIGFFVNTLVLRLDLSGNPTFRRLLGRVRDTTLGAYAHQDLPFEKLVAELQPERDVSRNPLFQVAFGLENTQRARPTGGGNGAADTATDPVFGTSKFDLTMMLSETTSGFAGSVEYSTDLFEHESITRLIQHFKTMVTAAAATPDLPLSHLPMVTDDERRHALRVNLTTAAHSRRVEGGLHGLVAAQAAKTPEAPAVIGDDGRLSYRELEENANRLAHELITTGVKPGAVVAICLPRGAAFLAAALASLKAGAAYLPLDPSYPRERLCAMLEDATAAVLITLADIARRIPGATLLLVDADRSRIEKQPSTAPPITFDQRLPAYLIYTSGSTGRPKGSLVTHDAFANLVMWYADELGLNRGDATLIVSALGFDLTQKNLFAPLICGGRVHFYSGDVFDPDDIVPVVDQYGITLINCTPSAFYPLADAAAGTGAMRSLRFAVLGGEPISIRRLWPWLSRLGMRARIVNSYGPTECTDVVAYYRVDDAASLLDRPVPIGQPVPNARLYVLDERLEPCPPNVTGELCVGGPCVSLGYLGRPGLTAAAFLPDPFADVPGSRLYRTGDLARVRGDGAIEYLGRIDHQVKVRGFRIELDEIETTLLRHPAVEAAAVVALNEGAGNRLAAFVVPDAEIAGPVRRLSQFEGDNRLAGYQVSELPSGLTVISMNRTETEFLHREIFVDRAYLQHGITLADGDCVFDIGGNIGLFALFVAHTVHRARIYSFEPLPPLVEALRLNVTLHGAPIEVMDYGLASRAGVDTFSFYPHVTIVSGRVGGDDAVRRTMRGYLQQHDDGRVVPDDALEELVRDRLEVQHFECPLKTLSEAICGIGVERIDLLKIDVERSELDVLRGLAEADWPRIRQIVIEVHDIDGVLAETKAILEDRGFEVVVATEDKLRATDIHMVYAVRPEGRRIEAVPRAAARHCWSSREHLLRDLREHLRRYLPDYMVPSSLAVLDAVPMTPNGKADRRRLQALALAGITHRRAAVLPRTPLEHVVCGIMREVLAVTQVGIHDSFFDLGGHSLMATQVVSRLRDTLRIGIPLRLLFEWPTGAGLAQAIATDRDTGESAKRTAEMLLAIAKMDDAEVARRLQGPPLAGEPGLP
jgi:amino acid adenylation domain-containing protein/FkbM family methyltransferase